MRPHASPAPDAQSLMGHVVKLADVVAYQKGAVVSKAIIDRRKGTVTVFAFDKGQQLSEHIAPFDALVYVLDGEGEITISGKPFRVRKGQMLIMPANQPHAVKAVEKFKMLLVLIRS
jgi:quercetin dioxygenase-like cupin family protein